MAELFAIKPSIGLRELLQLGSEQEETDTERLARWRLAEKIASVYIGMFVTRLADFEQGETAGGVSGGGASRREVEPGVVLDFAQRLVEGRHSHFEYDPFFTAAPDGSILEQEEARGWEWCPSGLPDGSWATVVVDTGGSTRLDALRKLARQAVDLVRQMPADAREMIAANYVEESAWMILGLARPKVSDDGEGGGAVKRLMYLLAECL